MLILRSFVSIASFVNAKQAILKYLIAARTGLSAQKKAYVGYWLARIGTWQSNNDRGSLPLNPAQSNVLWLRKTAIRNEETAPWPSICQMEQTVRPYTTVRQDGVRSQCHCVMRRIRLRTPGLLKDRGFGRSRNVMNTIQLPMCEWNTIPGRKLNGRCLSSKSVSIRPPIVETRKQSTSYG